MIAANDNLPPNVVQFPGTTSRPDLLLEAHAASFTANVRAGRALDAVSELSMTAEELANDNAALTAAVAGFEKELINNRALVRKYARQSRLYSVAAFIASLAATALVLVRL